MNTAEIVALIIVLGVLFLVALLIVASANEWLNFSGSASVKAVPAAKRRPRSAVEARNVLPGAAEQGAPAGSIAAGRRMLWAPW
jgi:hypothetical protein